jgi:hypothetical protein
MPLIHSETSQVYCRVVRCSWGRAGQEQALARSAAGGSQVAIERVRVTSVNSNRTGRPVLLCRTVARSTAYRWVPRHRDAQRHQIAAAQLACRWRG